MVDVRTSIIIDHPIAEVSEFAANPDNAPSWYVNINSATRITPGPVQQGSQIAFHARFLSRELHYTYEIVEYNPGQRLVMRTAQGPFPMQTEYSWEPLPDGRTRMELRNTGMPSGFSKVFAPVMAFMMKRANRNDLKRLKQLLESST